MTEAAFYCQAGLEPFHQALAGEWWMRDRGVVGCGLCLIHWQLQQERLSLKPLCRFGSGLAWAVKKVKRTPTNATASFSWALNSLAGLFSPNVPCCPCDVQSSQLHTVGGMLKSIPVWASLCLKKCFIFIYLYVQAYCLHVYTTYLHLSPSFFKQGFSV